MLLPTRVMEVGWISPHPTRLAEILQAAHFFLWATPSTLFFGPGLVQQYLPPSQAGRDRFTSLSSLLVFWPVQYYGVSSWQRLSRVDVGLLCRASSAVLTLRVVLAWAILLCR